MKKIIILLFCIIFLSCKEKNEEQKLIYTQLLHYRDELKSNTRAIEHSILNRADEDEFYKSAIENKSKVLVNYEKTFEELKFKDRNAIIKLRNSFKDENKLFLDFDTSNYNENISDTIFNRLMEIDFYRLKINFQNQYLLRHGCK
ncbi:MAG: hypothetical protein V4572_08175 [Bacteroidota bacterium]